MKIISSTKWTSDEHCLFNNACIRYGWGRWREIAEMIPTRWEIQVQSHAEKVAKKDPWKKKLLGTDNKLRGMQELQSKYLRAVRSGENEGICHWQRGLGLNYVMPPANGSSYSIGRIIFWSSQVYSLWPFEKMPHDVRFQWSWVSFHSLFVSNQQRISTSCIKSAFDDSTIVPETIWYFLLIL